MSQIDDWEEDDPLRETRGVGNGVTGSIVLWLLLFTGIWLLGGCANPGCAVSGVYEGHPACVGWRD